MGKADEFISYHSVFNSACKVETEDDAVALLQRYAGWLKKNSEDELSLEAATKRARGNIGYLLGYGAPKKTIELWERVGANHPVFGTLSQSVDDSGCLLRGKEGEA